MRAVTARAFLVVARVATKALFVFLQESPIPLSETGKGMSLLRAAIMRLAIFDGAALALDEIRSADKTARKS